LPSVAISTGTALTPEFDTTISTSPGENVYLPATISA
jgi:hypothetical protein